MMSPARGPSSRSATTSSTLPFTAASWPTGQHVEEQQVEQDVDRDDRQRADGQRARHVAAGIADLLRDVRRGVPARVGEHHRNQREKPARCQRPDRQLARGCSPIRRRS